MAGRVHPRDCQIRPCDYKVGLQELMSGENNLRQMIKHGQWDPGPPTHPHSPLQKVKQGRWDSSHCLSLCWMHTGSHGASPPKLSLVSIVTCSLDWLSVSVCVNVRVCELLDPAPQLGPSHKMTPRTQASFNIRQHFQSHHTLAQKYLTYPGRRDDVTMAREEQPGCPAAP